MGRIDPVFRRVVGGDSAPRLVCAGAYLKSGSLAASPKSWLDKQGGGLLYYLLWRELRDKVDKAPSH
ncbi:hypothetical protein MESS4_110170 [Mesorhizobium sp. STM 4661]|nr:hypothetical protein MESS4_110170 [Mesorhizobium sp. STM 4661]